MQAVSGWFGAVGSSDRGSGVADLLRERGHEVSLSEDGSVQAIHLGPAGEVGVVSDPRLGGAAGVVGRGVSQPALPRR